MERIRNLMPQDLTSQALSFDPVLPWEGQEEAVTRREDGSIYLRIKAPQAKRVAFVIGEKEYDCVQDGQGVWGLRFPYRFGFHFVQLVIDGAEVLTPLLPIGYGYSRPYNFVSLEREGEDFYRLKEVPHGSVRREYYYSAVTDTWESCLVYTPPEYEEEAEREYPVLYLQHGHGENEVGWITAGKVNFILDNLLAEHRAVPFLIVMNNGMVLTENPQGKRMVDYQLFGSRLIRDVIPFIEQRFRVKKDKINRAMAGLSMGSIQTCLTGFCHPDYFAWLGVFSGFMHDFIQGSELDMVQRENSTNEHLALLEDKERFHREFRLLFRAIGEEDPFLNHFYQDDALCRDKGIRHIRKTYGGGHDWNVWRYCIYDFAQYLFR